MTDLTARVKYLEQENRRLRGVLEKIVDVASAPPLEQPKLHEKQRHGSRDVSEFWRDEWLGDVYRRDIAKEFAIERTPAGGVKWDFESMDVPGNND